MTPLTKLIYHVTTYETAKRIIDSGFVDPKFSQGRQPVAWFVSSLKVTWAMAHICQRHQCTIEDIAIFTLKSRTDAVKRASKRGIYYCAAKLPVLEMTSASIWLQREERYIFIPGVRSRKVRRYELPDD